MRVVVLILALFASACAASGPAYDQAVSLHNVFRQVVSDVDASYAPVYALAAKEADAANPSDATAYAKAMRPFTDFLNALTTAKMAEQAINMVLSQWDATAPQSALLADTYACAADAASRLTTAAGQVPSSLPLYAAAFAVETQLRMLAGTTVCPVQAPK